MPWNWELPHWPHFEYDEKAIYPSEKEFLLRVGSAVASLAHFGPEDAKQFFVEILSEEGVKSAQIEGEHLDRASLQSSIQRHFGLTTVRRKNDRESAMADLLCEVYETWDQPLTHQMLWKWVGLLFRENGQYRTGPEPMQIVSNRYDRPTVFFEAPPSDRVHSEMESFIQWFNQPSEGSILGKAAMAHVYFESIHPFEDGNGRIGRALVEKLLSREVGKPVLIAMSKILEKRKKEYYAALERCNRTLEIGVWVQFFCGIVLEACDESLRLLQFLIAKSKMMNRLSDHINERQEKVLLRMFEEGPDGFIGGLSAEKYVAITQTSTATATRDLADLVEKGALTKTGELRHTRYWLKLT
jgi:Fic family protein